MRVILFAIGLFAYGAVSASTVTINFEALPNGGTSIGGDFVEVIDQGYRFVSELGVQNYGESGKAIVGVSSGIDFDTGEISISRVDGAAFALYSADISLASFYIASSDEGNFDSNSGPGLDELGTGAWLNINSVLFFGDALPFERVAIDNVVVSSAVPIPAAVWLLVSALACLGWANRM